MNSGRPVARAGRVMKIEFIQPKPRIEDWRVQMNGRTVGNVWRCGDGYLVSVAVKQSASTQDAAFKTARKQLRILFPRLSFVPTQEVAFKTARKQIRALTL